MNVEQPKLGRRGTLFLLIILGAFPPLTMDLYLPALPQMAEGFSTSHAMINLTLGAYMAAFAVGMLFWGPLSEKTGRKPILFAAIAIYIIASLLCAIVPNIESLIGFRVMQGLSGGGVTVVGTAIVKDLFDGRAREKVMATVMSLVIIAPMVAPVFGAFLLKVTTWRAMFVVLALFGCLAAGLVALYRETIEEKSSAPISKSWGRLIFVLKNPRFAYLWVLFSLVPMCLMAFLGTAAYVYIDDFGMSEQAFSYIFAFNGACAGLGPMLYMWLSDHIRVQTFVLGCLGVIIMSGMCLLVFAAQSQWIFAACAGMATLSVIALRVPGANLLLEQQTKDTGSAAALIQCGGTLMGAIGVQIVSANAHDLIRNYGLLVMAVGIICAIMWLAVQHRSFVADKVSKPL
ncbi:Bcr/CflA family efflux MFS transporter [Pacificibacter marinus]|uniref:Bcr/CflA family efflux MFS transporter n=1 Tax=Pacificibacter marinus TaxID=658057 RepID=UPI001C06BC7D|nr:Bcr/CflA family efflux MFS transporter [Pacificibacter marinus]MBU2869005.1 Bcr/CflA family efflux MFS transporter [Pacificibacter marinus]